MSVTKKLSSTPKKKRTSLSKHRYGGRATAGGVNYEVRVAALIATKMLAGECDFSVMNLVNRFPRGSNMRGIAYSALWRNRISSSRLHRTCGASGTRQRPYC